jgi:hypothetical protein
MRLRSRFYGVVLAIVGIAGCSHGAVRELPTAPSPPPVAVTMQRLAITRAAGLRIGNEIPITTSGAVTGATFGAVAQYTDGSAAHVEAAWTSSDESVIRIDGGVFKAIGPGTATLTAQAQGMTATEAFTVEPGVAGSFAGNVVINSCQAGSASLSELLCQPRDQGRPPGALHAGAAIPFTMTIAKGTGDALTAAIQFGNQSGTLAGTDRGLNFMTFKGDLTGNGATLTIVHWDARATANGMEGVIGFEVRVAGVPSHAVVTARFDNVTRR